MVGGARHHGARKSLTRRESRESHVASTRGRPPRRRYHIRGAHMMAISIVEIDDGKTPTVQFGNMFRIDPSKYLSQQQAIEREEAQAQARAQAPAQPQAGGTPPSAP